MKLLSPDGSNSVYNIIKAFKLSLYIHRDNLVSLLQNKRELLSFCNSIFKTKSKGQVFLYFCEHEAATAHIIQVQLELPESTTYNILRDFRRMGIIYRLRQIPINTRSRLAQRGGGPKPQIYGIVGVEDDKIAECINLHFRCLSPKFLVAEEVAQTIITDYLKPKHLEEISIIEIRKHVKSLRKPFVTSDLSMIVADVLKEMGVKVWR